MYYIEDVGSPRCEDPKLIILVIAVELSIQHIRPQLFINVTDRRVWQTTFNSNTGTV